MTRENITLCMYIPSWLLGGHQVSEFCSSIFVWIDIRRHELLQFPTRVVYLHMRYCILVVWNSTAHNTLPACMQHVEMLLHSNPRCERTM